MQSLRYASYVSKWRFEDFENVAWNHFGKIGDAEFNFNDMFESFCSDSGIDGNHTALWLHGICGGMLMGVDVV